VSDAPDGVDGVDGVDGMDGPDCLSQDAPGGLTQNAPGGPTQEARGGLTQDAPDGLTHLDGAGRARMVDVGEKPATDRRAVARAVVRVSPETAARVAAGDAPKGDVLATARIAGIQGGKRTSELIPLCHPLALSFLGVEASIDVEAGEITVIAEARTTGPTGVEMEALTAASVAALTVYDMVKGVERGAEITSVALESKSGGRSGTWNRS
jgi:cyclic pyranopterin phosphate synthase